MAHQDATPDGPNKNAKAASGGPLGVGHPTFGEAAARLLDNGYEPLPIVPATKRPSLSRWSSVTIDEASVAEWSLRHEHHGIGLRTGHLIGLDIDILDPDLSQALFELATKRLGATIQRVGLWPKRLLLYRAAEPSPKQSVGKVEFLGRGQQFVAYGIHPGTQKPYYWPDGDSPLDVPLSDLPEISEADRTGFLAEVEALLPVPSRVHAGQRSGAAATSHSASPSAPVRNENGLVTDGRDGWLSSIAFHALHDCLDAGHALDPDQLAARVWSRFETTTDLNRPRKGQGRPYDLSDARQKVADKLSLLEAGALPARAFSEVEPVALETAQPLGTARLALDQEIGSTAETIRAWREARSDTPPPRIAIKATVGLGKSVVARRHLLALRETLASIKAPDRIAVFTPSHKLAEEAAEDWRTAGVTVAVHRGYERIDPVSGAPMCQDMEAVQTAIAAGARVHASACDDGKDKRCRFFATCLKQQNQRDVAEADVVIAAYDALYTGFAAATSSFGVLLIDEACWPRAHRAPDRTSVASLETGDLLGLKSYGSRIHQAAAQADLHDLRTRLAGAARNHPPGPITRSALTQAGLTADECKLAAKLEERRIVETGLTPGSTPEMRAKVQSLAAHNEETFRMVRLWQALAAHLGGSSALSGRIRLEVTTGTNGQVEIALEGIHPLHANFADIPVLHLDATLRPELAARVFPGLTTTTIAAEMPHMTLDLITGSFGKSAMIGTPQIAEDEQRRRANKRDRCAEYVAWQARRVAPGRTLVITYKDCEDAFQNIPGVETAHFNAVAGLDRWREVALLIIIGRPLPRDSDVSRIAGALFDEPSDGAYRWQRKGITLSDGSVRGVRIQSHTDPRAEIIRAAICEDELIQCIGRGRGVNRTADTPLEVKLLAGIAVSSPQDAAGLYPHLFSNPEQAKKQFERSAFKRQIPYKNTYRGMSLKSAAYRRPGRGQSWQTAYWLDDPAFDPQQTLTAALGALAEWRPDSA